MKIVYVFSSLATVGGTERILTEKINYIIKHFGYDVTIITCYQPVNATNTFELSENVKQINIDIPYYLQYKHKYPKRLWVKWKSNRCLRKSISKIVQEINPDILIGVSRFKANYVSSIKCNAIKIIECHEVRYNTISDIGIKRSLPARIFLKIHEYFYFRTIERNANIVVTLTEQDKLLWKKAKRIEVIPDFSTMQICHHSDVSSKRVIFAGRLEWEKGVGRLIEIWSIVCSKHPDWHLDIYGEGRMYNTLVALIKIYKARNLTIHKFTPNISQEFATSSICAVTSYFEGCSLVILESLKHGVPCVAFDCPFGPRSIIIDANCGFLVDNNDIRLFAERLCFLIENEQLRKDFSKAAIQQAKKFDVDIIMNKWKCLFENCLKEKDDKSINSRTINKVMHIKLQLPKGFLDAEKRCGYQVTADMKKVWAVELDLLYEFQRVANKHNIKYIANGGTMLGAVRHKGFIPWDDDIDIMMMRDEYDRLCQIAPKEFEHPYFFQTEYTEPGSFRCHAQLRNSETTAIIKSEQNGSCTFNQGIFIDIFPLDAVPDEEAEWQKESKKAQKIYERMYHLSNLSSLYQTDKSAQHHILKKLLHQIGNPIFGALAHYYFQKYEIECKKYNHIQTKKISLYCWGYKYKKLHRDRADHLETILMDFEFLKVPICKNYDHALTQVFGDWHKYVIGGSLHGETFFDTEKSYTYYIKNPHMINAKA